MAIYSSSDGHDPIHSADTSDPQGRHVQEEKLPGEPVINHGYDDGKAPGLDVGVAEPHQIPVFDADYDDSWVADFPEIIGGYRVISIGTPKSVACSFEPLIILQATQESMDEFLSAPLDLNSLRAAIRSVPVVPSDIGLGFAGNPLDKEEAATNLREWNEANISGGCIQHRPRAQR